MPDWIVRKGDRVSVEFMGSTTTGIVKRVFPLGAILVYDYYHDDEQLFDISRVTILK